MAIESPEVEVDGCRIGAAHDPVIIRDLRGDHNGGPGRALAPWRRDEPFVWEMVG